MSKSPRWIFAAGLLILAILACNLPGSQSNSQPDLAGTITAQALTLQAPASPGSPAGTPSPSTPEVSVTSTTNCRTGPGSQYDLVFTMNPGASAQVVGKDTPDNYWIINNPTGGTCWLWGQYAVLAGNTGALPEYPAPPQPTEKFTKTPKPTKAATFTPTSGFPVFPVTLIILQPPAAPTHFAGNRDSCNTGIASDGFTPIWIEAVTLTWQDNATNETGYHIYKNNGLISTIPANSTSFNITLRYQQSSGNPLYNTFGVEAFNNAGASSRPLWDVPTCP